jgi:hypothetical protein
MLSLSPHDIFNSGQSIGSPRRRASYLASAAALFSAYLRAVAMS